jgi:hypothetical protein
VADSAANRCIKEKKDRKIGDRKMILPGGQRAI